jgi:SPP1 gp7 family putative phage head morphogenesis protein
MHVGHARMLALSGAFHASGKALTPEGRQAVWVAMDAVKANRERPVARAYAETLQRQADEVLRTWARVGPGQMKEQEVKAEADVMVGGIVFDARRWAREMEEEFGPIVAAILEDAFAAGTLRVGRRELGFRLTERAAEELDRVVGLIRDSSETTRESVGRIIRAGMESGASVDDVAAALRAQFTEWTGWRARLVAQTTVTSTYALGQQEAFSEAGVTHNEWLTQRDDRVRPEHEDLDGEVVEIGRAFSNGLTHPQEPGCRCDLLPVMREEKAGRPWRVDRDARMRAHYESVKGRYPNWEQAVEDVRDNVEGAASLTFDYVRQIVHSTGKAGR